MFYVYFNDELFVCYFLGEIFIYELVLLRDSLIELSSGLGIKILLLDKILEALRDFFYDDSYFNYFSSFYLGFKTTISASWTRET